MLRSDPCPVPGCPHPDAFTSLSEIMEFLHAEVVPGLRERLQKFSSEETQQEVQQEPMYLLSEICSEEDFAEVDNTG